MVVKWHGPRVKQVVRSAALQSVVAGATLVHKNATRRMRSAKTGSIYQRRGIVHKASAPGEAPAIDTGNLARSGGISLDQANIVARVNFSAEYAAHLEFGTEKMEARPFLRPALVEETPAINRDFVRRLRAMLVTRK